MADNTQGGSPSNSPAPSNSVTSESQVDSNDVSMDSDESSLESSDNSEGLEHSSEAEIDSDPNLTKAEKKEAKKMLKKLGIKYNGKEEDVELPFEIPEEHADFMRRQLQMAKMGQNKAQELSALEKDVVSFLQELKANPKKALSNPSIGVDIKKLAAEILQEELENANKTPEQLKQEEYERKLKEYEEKEKKREEALKQMERERAVEQAAQKFDIDIATTLEKFDIPQEPIAIKRIAELMSLEIQRGFEPNMEAIGNLVQEEMNSDIRNYIKKLPHDKRLKILGEDVFEEDRKARVAKVKKAPPTAKQVAKDVQKVEKKEETPGQKISYKDFFKI
jgi:hypothetical protein